MPTVAVSDLMKEVPAPTLDSLIRSFHGPTMSILLENAPAPLCRGALASSLGFAVLPFETPVTTKKAVLEALIAAGVAALPAHESVVRSRLAQFPTPSINLGHAAPSIGDAIAQAVTPTRRVRIHVDSDAVIRRITSEYEDAPEVICEVPREILQRCYATASREPLHAYLQRGVYTQALEDELGSREESDEDDRPELSFSIWSGGDTLSFSTADLLDLIREQEGDDDFDFDD